jgi:hypothetical protein
MHEHGEPSERFPVVDLSPEEVDSLPDTSQDEEIAQKLFGDLNCGLLGMPHDDNIIILSDFNKEEEVRMDDRDEVVPSSAASPLPMMMHLTRCTMVVVAVGFLIRCQMVVMMVETRSVRLRLLHQKGCPQGRALKSLRITIILHCCITNSSIKDYGDGGAESLLSQLLSCLMQFFLLFYFLYYLVDPLWYFCRNVI